MSRVGNKPIKIPDGVTVSVDNRLVKVSGPKGELTHQLKPGFEVTTEDQQIRIKASNQTKIIRELHGLSRTLIENMITGVSEGFSKKLEFHGVGYRAAVEGSELVLSLGFSHPIRYQPKEGIEITVEKNIITVSGINKHLVGQTAAEIRDFKKPEPYKGKGIKYIDEHIRRKAGKAAVKGSE